MKLNNKIYVFVENDGMLYVTHGEDVKTAIVNIDHVTGIDEDSFVEIIEIDGDKLGRYVPNTVRWVRK